MAAKLLGAHMPGKGGLHMAVRRGHEIGCTAVQVFTSSPQQWKAKPPTEANIADLEKARVDTGIRALVSHDSYLVNLCAPDSDQAEKSYHALRDEIMRCHALGIGLVVSHLGAHMGQGEEVGLAKVASQVTRLLADTPDDVTLLGETTAGQGSSLDYKFDHLGKLMELTNRPERFGVCVDTCHIFAAGYDIRDPEGYEATFAEFDRLVGIDRIKAIHVNDSKKALGTRVDRHNHIGEGEIGIEAFRCLVNDPRFENVPMLLETPDAETDHARNLATLMGLRN